MCTKLGSRRLLRSRMLSTIVGQLDSAATRVLLGRGYTWRKFFRSIISSTWQQQCFAQRDSASDKIPNGRNGCQLH